VILPYSEPTKSPVLNWILVLFNYALHFIFVGLHQYSYWKVSLTDAGYVSSHFETRFLEEVEEMKTIKDKDGNEEEKLVKKMRYEIFDKKDMNVLRAQEKANADAETDLESMLLPSLPTVKKFTVNIDPENKSFIGYRICKTCNDIKPPRTHHCSICRKCVMRMDHHCPWTGNCVGLKTHKYFMCFTFWTVIACLHVGLSSPLLNKHIRLTTNKSDFKFVMDHQPLNPLLAQIMSLSVAVGVLVLHCLHIYYVNNNVTTLEAAELMMFGNPYKFKNSDNNFK
jgi:hypothetical protein